MCGRFKAAVALFLLMLLLAGSSMAAVWSIRDIDAPQIEMSAYWDAPTKTSRVYVQNVSLSTYTMGLNIMDFSTGNDEMFWIVDSAEANWYVQSPKNVPGTYSESNTTYGVHMRTRYSLTYYDVGVNVELAQYGETAVAWVYFDVTPKVNRQDVVLYHNISGYLTGSGSIQRYPYQHGWLMERTSATPPTSDAWLGVSVSSGVGVARDFVTQLQPEGTYYKISPGMNTFGQVVFMPFYTITTDTRYQRLVDELAQFSAKPSPSLSIITGGKEAANYALTNQLTVFNTTLEEPYVVPVQSQIAIMDASGNLVSKDEIYHWGNLNTSYHAYSFTFTEKGTYTVQYAWLDYHGNAAIKTATIVVDDVPPYVEQLMAYDRLQGVIMGLLAGVIPLLLIGWWGTQPFMGMLNFFRTRNSQEWVRMPEYQRREYMYENFGGYGRTSLITLLFLLVVGYMFLQVSSITDSPWIPAAFGGLGSLMFFIIKRHMFETQTYKVNVLLEQAGGLVVGMDFAPFEGEDIPPEIVQSIDRYVAQNIAEAMPLDQIISVMGRSYDLKSITQQSDGSVLMIVDGDYKPNYFMPMLYIAIAGIASLVTWGYGAALGVATPPAVEYLIDVGGAVGSLFFFVDVFSYHVSAALTGAVGYAVAWQSLSASLKWVVGIGGIMSGGARVGVAARR